MDRTIPKQFILEINSQEKFTRRGWSLKFCFQFIKAPKPCFLPVPRAVCVEPASSEAPGSAPPSPARPGHPCPCGSLSSLLPRPRALPPGPPPTPGFTRLSPASSLSPLLALPTAPRVLDALRQHLAPGAPRRPLSLRPGPCVALSVSVRVAVLGLGQTFIHLLRQLENPDKRDFFFNSRLLFSQ